MANIFGDESADERAERVFAVAAIMGTDKQWEEFVPAWVDITEGQEFHAAEWEALVAHDKELLDKRQKSYRKLTELIAWSGMHGWGVAVDLVSYRKAFPHITSDHAYHKCFIEVVERLIKDAIGLCHRDLKLTFDCRQGSGTTGRLYDWISSLPQWEGSLLFADKISFANRKNPRIQAADLLARETMKGLYDKIGPSPRSMRKSLITLASSARHFQFRFLMDDYFEQMREGLARDIERCKNEYDGWLRKMGAQDNLDNRHRFMIWQDAQALRGERRTQERRIPEIRQRNGADHERSSQQDK
ncbi:MAG TPA: hypothetical protein VKY85_13095 [Candidatus Angelobacter sp.]|nr:hypothetical protein [Candidatus Angelobacter sp.]